MHKGIAKKILRGLLKLLSLDACFLKGPWDGHVCCAVDRDVNDHMYYVAWGVAQTKKKETWGWFLEHLKKTCRWVRDMGGPSSLTNIR